MAHEILSVKLCELDERLAGLRSRIRLSESADARSVEAEAAALGRECELGRLTLRDRLRNSRAGSLAALADSFERVESIVSAADADSGSGDEVERKLLFAEYELDFAMLAADRALWMSLDAIAAQLRAQEKKEGNDI